jgi:SAM-dependent methyltransferase
MTGSSEEKTLREAWDENAADWARWARSPELDHAFWRLNLPTLINLLPALRGLTLDVGCGEGRVARALKERGYRVVGVESSRALVTAAQEADPSFDVHLADAAQMPFPDDHFDLVSRTVNSLVKYVMLWHAKNWTAQAGVGVD